ncbi:MAG: Rieske 2Fe-2S domain-containing protein [Dehalococcoidia bacterium]
MTCILHVEPEERTAFAYLLLAEIGRLRHGTGEHQEVASGLQSVYEGFVAVPEGAVEVETLNDEMYMLGVRNHADASEMEEFWLDNKASMRHRHQPAPFPDENIGRAIQTYFLEVVADPENWHFNQVRPIFIELGFKIDRSLTEGAPRVRGLYNKERAEIIRRTRMMQAERAVDRGRTYPRGVEIEAWRRALRVEQLASGEMTELKLDGTRLLLANVGGEFYALSGTCTHAPELSAISGLADGELDPASFCVTCPWHGAQYDLRNGRVMRQPYAPEFNRDHLIKGRLLSVVDFRRTATEVRTYETKVEDGHVWVNVV